MKTGTQHSMQMGLTLIAICLVAATNAVAAEPSPSEIIDAAIKAAGGAEAIAKQKAVTSEESGTYYGAGAGLPYKANYALQLPDQFRMEITGVFAIVCDGKRAWRKAMGTVTELEGGELQEQKESAYSMWVTTLLPLKEKAKEFTLTAAGERKIGDKAARGVKVASKGHRDITLWFDNETKLLAGIETTINSAETGGKDVKQETHLSDYVEVEKVKLSKRYVMFREGVKFVESEMTAVKIVDKLPEGTFGKPE